MPVRQKAFKLRDVAMSILFNNKKQNKQTTVSVLLNLMNNDNPGYTCTRLHLYSFKRGTGRVLSLSVLIYQEGNLLT